MVQKRGGVSTFSSLAHSFCGIGYLARVFSLCVILAHCGPPTWTGGIHAHLAWSERGVRVISVPEGSAAAEAGLLPDDRIVAIDRKSIANLTKVQVHERLQGEVGSFVTLGVLRGETPLELKVERIPYERDKPR